MNKEELLREYQVRVAQASFKRYRPYGHPETLCPDGELWKRSNWPTWSNKPWQLEFHSSGKENSERGAIDANGVGKCATIRIHVETPQGRKRLRDIWGTQTEVLTWPDGEPRHVKRWIKKPPEECFRIVLRDGRWFEGPSGHLILGTDGWTPLASVVSSFQKEYDGLPGLRCVFRRLVRALDVRRWFGTLRGLWDRYFVGSRLCGGQLLLEEEGVQVFSPLQDDVPRHIPAWCSFGELVHKYTNILSLFFGHLSMPGFYLQSFFRCGIGNGHGIHSNDAEQRYGLRQEFSRPRLVLDRRVQEAGEVEKYLSVVSSYRPFNIDANDIVAVYAIGVHALYDMEVEDRHNYLAGGLINHNSFCTTWETAAHAMGEYPPWYDGFKFDKPVEIWIGAIDADQQRSGVQNHLLGKDLEKNLGTGFIPRDRIHGKVRTRQAGISDVADKVLVRHKSGGFSVVVFKTYAQGWRSWQAGKPNIIQLDEEPDENDAKQRDIFEECQTRIFRSGGILYAGLTPLLGETELTKHFMQPKAKGIYCIYATWDDAPHLNEAGKDRLRKTYGANKLATRTQGIPMMGEGRVFSVDDNELKIPQFEIPRYFARISGIDFGVGVGHPTAGAWLAWDRDKDIVYLYDVYRKEQADAIYHAEAFKKRGKWIPVAWPHDGHKTSDITKTKADGFEVKDIYRNHGLNMLGISARYATDTGGSQPQEPIIEMLEERMKTGRFRVTENCHEFFDEYRSFHRKDGKIINRREDVIKAVLYAMMMLRYAHPEPTHRIQNTSSRPLRMAL